MSPVGQFWDTTPQIRANIGNTRRLVLHCKPLIQLLLRVADCCGLSVDSGLKILVSVVQFRPWPPDFAGRGADRSNPSAAHRRECVFSGQRLVVQPLYVVLSFSVMNAVLPLFQNTKLSSPFA